MSHGLANLMREVSDFSIHMHAHTFTVDPIVRASVLHEKFVVLNKNHIQHKFSLRN